MRNNIKGISKKSKIIAITAFVLGLTAFGGGVANASGGQDDWPMSDLVTATADKFGLSTILIQTKAKELHAERRDDRDADDDLTDEERKVKMKGDWFS